MSATGLRPLPDGSFRFEGLGPFLVHVLLELPTLLDPDQPDAVRRRLFPHPAGDEDSREEWRRYVHPELFALIASAREIVSEDLAHWSLRLPRENLQAWISALNTARLTLGAAHDLGEEDMEEEPEGPWDEHRLAVAKVHALGYLQHLLIEATHPPPPGADQEG